MKAPLPSSFLWGVILSHNVTQFTSSNMYFPLFQLPELMHVTEQSDQSKIALFLLQNIGIIVGFVGMFFLAYYKKDINIL